MKLVSLILFPPVHTTTSGLSSGSERRVCVLFDDPYEAATDNDESDVSEFSSNDDANDGDVLIKEGDYFSTLPLDPALILKYKKPKVILNPYNLLVNTNPTGVINVNYMRDHFLPYLKCPLAKTNADCIVMMDSATTHTYSAVLAAFRHVGLRYAIIPGGLTMFGQSIDTALAALYRTGHHHLHVAHMEGKHKPTVAHAWNVLVDFCHNALVTATSTLDVPKVFQELGYIDPTKAKLPVSFQFPLPAVLAGDALPPKPKPKSEPKPVARQLSMASFLCKN